MADEGNLTPVVEVEGNLIALRRDSELSVDICEKCAHLDGQDGSWRTEGACFNVHPDMLELFSRSEDKGLAAIRKYCDVCPVVSECLEYAATNHKANAGMVWGGIYFSTRKGHRLKAIEQKRKELAA